MKGLKIVASLIGVLIAIPISLYLQYKTLKMINATELMMFLYWVNVPLVVFIQIVFKLTEEKKS